MRNYLLKEIMLALLLMGLSAAPVLATVGEARTALVVGNAGYGGDTSLRNPVNDAHDMAEALRAVGFEVTQKENLDKRGFDAAVSDFASQLQQRGGVGLFYYSGHGVQALGENYLIPVGAAIRSEADVEYEAVNARRVLRNMELAGNGLNIVVLDACRNNPYRSWYKGEGSKGLGRMDAPTGSIIAYATAPGTVAADGADRNSPYTTELLHGMRTPGLGIEHLFKQVRIQVARATNNRQVPWESSSLMGDFFFVPPPPPPPPPVNSPSPTPTPPPPPPVLDEDAMACEALKTSTNPVAFESYLQRFKQGRCVRFAEIRLLDLKPPPKPVEAPTQSDAARQAYQLAQSQYRQASQSFENLVKRTGSQAPAPGEARQQALELARQADQAQNYEQAAVQMASARQRLAEEEAAFRAKRLNVHLMAVQALLDAGKIAAARRALEDAKSWDQQEAVAAFRRKQTELFQNAARAFLDQGQWNLAREVLNDLQQWDPQAPEYQALRGRLVGRR